MIRYLLLDGSLVPRFQTDAAKQVLEAPVMAQRVQLGFYVEIAQPERLVFEGSFQPDEGFIVFLQAHVNHCDVIG